MTITTLLQIFHAMFTSGRAYAQTSGKQQERFFPEAVNDAATLAAAQYDLSEGQRLVAQQNFADGVKYQQTEG